MYDELGGYGVLIIFVLVLLVYVLGVVLHLAIYVLAGMYTFLALLGAAFLCGLDALFSGPLFADHPEVGWAVCGLILGAGVGAWTIAPVYGLRRSRPIVLMLPVLLVLALMTLGLSKQKPLELTQVFLQRADTSHVLDLPLAFTDLSSANGASVAKFKIGDKQVNAPLVSFQARAGEPDVPLNDAAMHDIGGFKLLAAPRYAGTREDGPRDEYDGSYELQLVSGNQVVAALAIVSPGRLAEWDPAGRKWQLLAKDAAASMDFDDVKQLGLAKLVTAKRHYKLICHLDNAKTISRSQRSKYSFDVANFPSVLAHLSLQASGERQLVPAVEKRLADEQRITSAFAKPLNVDIQFDSVLPSQQGNSYADVVFDVNGQRIEKLEPLDRNLALEAVSRNELDTPTKYRDLEHYVWEQTPEFNMLVRFCCSNSSSDGSYTSANAVSGSYVVTAFSRTADFALSFEVTNDGRMEVLLPYDEEVAGLRSGRDFISVPATQLRLPGDPPYFTVSFRPSTTGRADVNNGSSSGPINYSFPTGILTFSSTLRAGIR